MRKSKTFLITLLGLLIISSTSFAMTKTKHLRAGDTELVIESPMGMCFVDSGNPATAALFNDLQYRLSDTSQKQILAVFTPCITLAQSAGGLSADKILENYGYIAWLYPSVGYTYNKGRKAFISDTIKKYHSRGRKGLIKLDNGLATMIRGSKKNPDGTMLDEISLIAYTVVRDIPIEIKLKDKLENFGSANDGYDILNQFINYQIKINE